MPRAIVVANPGSGRSHPERTAAVARTLADAGWIVEEAAVGDGARLETIGADAVRAGVDVVVAIGGDGTVAALAHALAGTDVALGVVPAGTGNVVARNLGIPRAPVEAARLIARGRRRRIDLGRISTPLGETRTFAIACGVGFDAHVMRRTPAALKRRWGQPAYFMTSVALSGEIRNVPMTITADGVSRDLEAAEVLIANMGQVMQGIRPRRDIVLDDGQLDIVVVQASGPFEGLMAAWEAFRHPGPEDRPGGRVQWMRATEARIEAAAPLPVEADGDPAGRTPDRGGGAACVTLGLRSGRILRERPEGPGPEGRSSRRAWLGEVNPVLTAVRQLSSLGRPLPTAAHSVACERAIGNRATDLRGSANGPRPRPMLAAHARCVIDHACPAEGHRRHGRRVRHRAERCEAFASKSHKSGEETDMSRVHRSHTHRAGLWAEVQAGTADGDPLDTVTRRTLERSFDIDLSAIRIHVGRRPDRLARTLHADAFAAGPHLFFRAGAFRPRTEPGLLLLAHEVAHSIQQAENVRSGTWPARDAELLADQAAGRVVAGTPALIGGNLDAVPPLSPDGPIAIQRHSSWEHRLLGDATSSDLYDISHAQPNRPALLEALHDYLKMWSLNPDSVKAADITKAYPGIRTVTLKTSGLLATYGELNTLPDYVANAGQMDDLPRDILFPILQAVRQEGYGNVMALLGQPNDIPKFAGSVSARLSNGTMNDVWESIWLDVLTADLPPDLPAGSLSQGTNMYGSILARNACHFAPYSWYRWRLSYDAALAKAQEAYKTKDPQTIHEAWIQHGYADHFLQDSFAAGHLVNKTLVMQWFVEWASQKWFVSVPDWVEVQTMTTARQPGLAARGLYSATPGGVRDPQTTQEQATEPQRIAMSGVQADGSITQASAYQNYLILLNNAVSQSATLALHDYLNKTGLYVASVDQPTPYQVWGDGTLLTGGDGVKIASDTAHMSQQSIQDVLDTGATSITPDKIRTRFPTSARAESGQMLALEQWNDSMRNRANQEFDSVHDIVLSLAHPRMGHVSADISYFYLKVSRNGMEGYLGRGPNDWAVLADRDHAAQTADAGRSRRRLLRHRRRQVAERRDGRCEQGVRRAVWLEDHGVSRLELRRRKPAVDLGARRRSALHQGVLRRLPLLLQRPGVRAGQRRHRIRPVGPRPIRTGEAETRTKTRLGEPRWQCW